MKDLYKNPNLYYIVVPVVVALWPLLVWGMYLPQVKEALDSEVEDFQKGQGVALEIFKLDPERLKLADSNDVSEGFSYTKAVDRVANLYNIPPSRYRLSTGMLIKKDGQKSQSAHLKLEQVGIVQFVKFFWRIQLQWGDLQCDRVKLTKVEGLADIWNVEIDFKYYY